MSGLFHFILLIVQNFGLLAVVLLGSLGYGSLFINITGLYRATDSLYYISAVSIGLGILAHLTFVLASLQILYQPNIIILILIGIISFLFSRPRFQVKLLQVKLPSSLVNLLLLSIIVANLFYPILTDALVPPTWWDEVAYHLAVPKIYIQNHGFTYIPFIPYSNWPMEAEMLFTVGLILGSETLPHLIEWISFLLTCWGLFWLGNRFFLRQTGLIAVAIFSTTPMVITLAGTGLIEPTLTLFVLLATIFYLEWTVSQKHQYWVMSAIFGGLAASTKLNAALVPFVIGILISISEFGNSRSLKYTLRILCLFGFTSFIVVAPWYLKTLVYTKNLFWPFLIEIFGGSDWDSLGNEYLFGFIRKPNLSLTFSNWFTALWHLSLDYLKFGNSQIRIGIHFLILSPFAILAYFLEKASMRQILSRLVVICLIYYTLWFFQTHQARFLMPTLPVMSILAARGVSLFIDLNKINRVYISRITLYGLIFLLLYAHWLANPASYSLIADRWSFLSGQINREEFLITRVSGYSAFSYANNSLPKDAYVLLALYESRGYYLERKYMWANPISQRVLRFEQFGSPNELMNDLADRGFTHILFRKVGLERYSYIRYSEKITALVSSILVENSNLILSTPEAELYELIPVISEKR
jgi:4-amino-4-deoxy-L-arabinose transferase-like glycosyltransferase